MLTKLFHERGTSRAQDAVMIQVPIPALRTRLHGGFAQAADQDFMIGIITEIDGTRSWGCRGLSRAKRGGTVIARLSGLGGRYVRLLRYPGG